uniref:Uncharacterized protein n=1 Tax=Streptomyces roseochromogenus subsp. oscitans TaxID=149682 RepID=Q8GHD3_STRRC|nr:hypothetical protein [Streptomyces roseochromogenus subsp. oscitans DS 12.976]
MASSLVMCRRPGCSSCPGPSRTCGGVSRPHGRHCRDRHSRANALTCRLVHGVRLLQLTGGERRRDHAPPTGLGAVDLTELLARRPQMLVRNGRNVHAAMLDAARLCRGIRTRTAGKPAAVHWRLRSSGARGRPPGQQEASMRPSRICAR